VWVGGIGSPTNEEEEMSESVYRVTEVIGVSTDSWEQAARNAIDTVAARSAS
jgi:hypothetical protein